MDPSAKGRNRAVDDRVGPVGKAFKFEGLSARDLPGIVGWDPKKALLGEAVGSSVHHGSVEISCGARWRFESPDCSFFS